jgi:hypothetical protein
MENGKMKNGVLTGHVILNLTLKNEYGKRANANRILTDTTEQAAERLHVIIPNVALGGY